MGGWRDRSIEEVLIKKFGYFLSMPLQVVSIDIIPIQLLEYFPKNRRNKDISS